MAGCTSRHLSGEELTAFVADESHGLSKSVTAGNNVTVKVTYRPTDLWVYQDSFQIPVFVTQSNVLGECFRRMLYQKWNDQYLNTKKYTIP